MATINSASKLVADIAERTALTYVEAFLGLLRASGTTNLIALSALGQLLGTALVHLL
ncbi:hypothetical protein ACQEVY_18755 [Streptomyces sp. CA-288835]|uniref:hypothetical protein n=1 Tax=Streptomyces sp. CA-288835 TaxID=3240069 RepID=UPI003D91938B